MGSRKPAWLVALDTEKFFIGCSLHENAKKNEKNICCLDCLISICPHCVHSHRFHRLLQIRRYVYHNVVRLEDMDKLIDCTNVQSYTINSSKVVFLKKRPQNRQFKGNMCTSCDRSLQEPYIHCSVGCKVDYVLEYRKDLSPYLRRCETLLLSSDCLVPNEVNYGNYDNEANETTNSTIVEEDGESGGSDTEDFAVICTEMDRKSRGEPGLCARSASNLSKEDMAANMSRRKGIPHRSPLC